MIKQVKILTIPSRLPNIMELQINELISQGWQPIGDIKILKIDNAEVLMQQMHLRESQESQESQE